MTIDLEIEINEEPFDIVVDFVYYPSEPMIWTYSNGDPGHPGSPAEVDILSIQDENGSTVPDELINSKWSNVIIEKCLEYAENYNLNDF